MEQKDQDKTAPKSPEGYPKTVREQLDQHGQTHEGVEQPASKARPGSMRQRGATEDEVTPIKPPMSGPGDLLGEAEDDDDEIHPADELTPG